MANVWRIEHDDGYGPYSTCVVPMHVRYKAMGILDGNTRVPNWPMPNVDGITWPKPDCENVRDWYFGFASISQMYRWFPSDAIKALLALGFRVIEYEANEVREGKSQVMFNKFTAKVLRVLSLIEGENNEQENPNATSGAAIRSAEKW